MVKGEFLTADPFSKKRSNYSSKYASFHHTWNSIISKSAVLKAAEFQERHISPLSTNEADFHAMCLDYSRSSLAIYKLDITCNFTSYHPSENYIFSSTILLIPKLSFDTQGYNDLPKVSERIQEEGGPSHCFTAVVTCCIIHYTSKGVLPY